MVGGKGCVLIWLRFGGDFYFQMGSRFKKKLFLWQESDIRFGQFVAAEATTSSLVLRAGTLGVLPRLPDPISL